MTTSTSATSSGKLIESSYTREYQGNSVPRDYVFLTYDDWDAYDKPWLVSPAPLPMHGKYLLKMMAESVGLACVTDGAATPKYCLKEFFTSLNAMDTELWPLLLGASFGDAQVTAVESVLATKICTACNEKLFDYMYLSWADASDDDKYLRVYMEMACSKAPNDNNEQEWCLPVLKDMEDETRPATGDQAAMEKYVRDQADLWCDDLCVKIIKDKERLMGMIDLYANVSYSCDMKTCTEAQKTKALKEWAQEAAQESAYCRKVRYVHMREQRG